MRFAGALALIPIAASIAAAKPPPGWVDTSAGRKQLSQSSYCWNEQGRGVCADYLPPRCGDGRTPRIPVRLSETVRFRLGLAPSAVSLDFFGKSGIGRSYRLAAGRVVAWRVRQLGAFTLFARVQGRGDTSYAGCFVTRS
jgi:hypothetical protein